MSPRESERACWSVIERARAEGATSSASFEDIAERVHELLAQGPVEAIVAYDQGCAQIQARSYTWALWGAAYVINGGCSDDGFEYFRGWLLTQGQAVFEAALADPDSIAAVLSEDDEDLECEDMLYVAERAYEALTGEQLDGATLAYSDLGEGWDFDDTEQMRARYPRLWAMFGWDDDGSEDADESDS